MLVARRHGKLLTSIEQSELQSVWDAYRLHGGEVQHYMAETRVYKDIKQWDSNSITCSIQEQGGNLLGNVIITIGYLLHDPVNHPAHYTNHPSGIECIQITEHLNFCLGNAIKYIWRAGLKDTDSSVEDLQKARWYLTREIERITAVSTSVHEGPQQPTSNVEV